MPRDTHQLNARIPVDLFEKVSVIASLEGTSVTQLTAEALETLVEQRRKRKGFREELEKQIQRQQELLES